VRVYETFVKRFLLHVLPLGFYKIRYFGVLASANARAKKEQCLSLIDKPQYLSELEGKRQRESYARKQTKQKRNEKKISSKQQHHHSIDI
jgi:hypothetical protein